MSLDKTMMVKNIAMIPNNKQVAETLVAETHPSVRIIRELMNNNAFSLSQLIIISLFQRQTKNSSEYEETKRCWNIYIQGLL